MLDKMLGIKYPIIQGAMAHIATAEFAAAVSNEGALGIIAAGGMKPAQLVDEIRKCKSLTDKIFGVNIMLMHPQKDELAKIVYDEGIRVVTTGAGTPQKYISMWKSKDMFVFPVVPNLSLARIMSKLDVDAVIAEGTESGGHVGEMTTMALVPLIKKNLDIKVIAAGGVASKEQFLAVKVLGAIGAQIGTALLASHECPIHRNYKDRILKAKDSQITVTGRFSGVPIRLLKNQMTLDYIKEEKKGLSQLELEKYTLGSLKRAVKEGDTVHGSLMAGQVAAMVDEEDSLKNILYDITNIDEIIKKL